MGRTRLHLALLITWGVALSTGLADDFSAWPNSLRITFSGYTRTEALTNFPALVVLAADRAGFRLGVGGLAQLEPRDAHEFQFLCCREERLALRHGHPAVVDRMTRTNGRRSQCTRQSDQSL